MPAKLGPRASERNEALAWSNSLGVRLRLAQHDPLFSAFAEAASEEDDLPAGLFLLIRRMDPARLADGHPSLAGAA